jgi:uncharacterized protein involved in exopolysaccharide biosynthesis
VALAVEVLAYAFSFLLPRKYTSTATFFPEDPRSGIGAQGLLNLAGGAALSLPSSGRSPEFYSRLLKSRHLQLQILDTHFDGGGLIAHYGFGDREDSLEAALRELAGDYRVSVDRLPQIVRIDVEMTDPRLAREVAGRFMDLVNEFSADIRTRQAAEKGKFLNARLAESREELDEAENELRLFLKRNRSFDSPELAFEKRRLERRLSIAQELYLVLSREVQSVAIEVVDDVPRISVIDEPAVPDRPSSPRRMMICLAAFLAAFVLATFSFHARRSCGAGPPS